MFIEASCAILTNKHLTFWKLKGKMKIATFILIEVDEMVSYDVYFVVWKHFFNWYVKNNQGLLS